jgi:hypothetical protein
MTTIRSLRSFIVPTGTQIITSLGISLVYLGLYFHDRLTQLITGASGTKPVDFQESYQHQVNAISQLGFTKDLTIGIFWAGVGIIGYFLVITIVNLIIALRNEVVVDSMYAHSGTLRSHFVEPLVRLGLIVVFALVLLLTLGALIPGVWLPMFGNLVLFGFSWLYLVQEIVAVLGLALNVYVLLLLFLAIKNTAEFV